MVVGDNKSCRGSGSQMATRSGKQQQHDADGSEGKSAGRAITRKGPWTEQEDVQLVWFVRLLGERRWDFLAKVSGLNRTGKSCRLRWVNYLHPGLKRGRMTPDEERLVVQLHAKWGNRWSRIAKSMPGRTDNEIKNYWRTHTRKTNKLDKATTSACSSSSNNDQLVHDDDEESPASQELYTTDMDQLLPVWDDIDADGWSSVLAGMGTTSAMPASPVWDAYCSDSLWGIADNEDDYIKMLDAS